MQETNILPLYEKWRGKGRSLLNKQLKLKGEEKGSLNRSQKLTHQHQQVEKWRVKSVACSRYSPGLGMYVMERVVE
jgi:hypothetical protein